jgi:hypothetical protein
VSGVPAAPVLTMSTVPSAFLTSHVQPEPKLPTADLTKASLKVAYEPNLALMAAASAPLGSPPLHAIPEKGVVPDLGRIVVNAAAGFFDDLFERHGFKLGAFLQVVEVHHIRTVVLAMVVLKGFLAVVRGQCVDRIRERGELVFHDFPRGG